MVTINFTFEILAAFSVLAIRLTLNNTYHINLFSGRKKANKEIERLNAPFHEVRMCEQYKNRERPKDYTNAIQPKIY